jgi:hypothetical protein
MPDLFAIAPAGQPELPAIPVGALPVALGGVTVWRCGEAHLLFAPPHAPALVNGRPVVAGIRVLAHRDQIQLGSAAWWFAAEDPPRVQPFPGGAGGVCPRCRRPVEAGAAAVRCGCGNWFHEEDGWPCYTYAPQCPVCKRATALGGAAALPLEECEA